ncbi:FkbM family methyltransferase [Alphaproteobacteria bacterium]|nr:FkbM family methyltransferase [Alphaproteobacteria bacterium]
MELEEFKKKISSKNQQLFLTIKDPITSKTINYSVSNDTTLWRAQSLFKKEPITIEWIRSFKKNSVFYDVGANVGMYSIFAGYVSEVKVYSFEPESNNFQMLMENILINNLGSKINPYPISISNVSGLTTLYLSKFEKGSSHHMVGESLDHNLNKRETKLRQGIFSSTLDDLNKIWKLPKPNYLKIDVDGIEYKIIEKSYSLLQSKELQSVLIEINPDRDQDKQIINTLKSFDFFYDQQQVDKAKRKSGTHIGYAEYLFYKK